MAHQDTVSEELVSGSATPLKFTLIIVPAVFGSFLVAAVFQTYVAHERSFSLHVLLFWFGLFCAFVGFSLFVLNRLMDVALAKVGTLALRKQKSVIYVPYASIQKMGVFRGRSGSVAWIRMREATGRRRLFFFVARDDYATSWPRNPETDFLWKLVSQDRNEAA